MIKKIVYALAVSQLLLVVYQFSLTLGRATDGDKLFELETSIAEISRQNTEVSAKILGQTTTARLYEYALSTGYIPQSVTQFDPPPVAVRLDLP